MLQKLLIANRGEIACRIIKTAKKMGISTVAIYSTADSQSLHTLLADEAYLVGEAKAIESYLNIENIIKIAKLTKSDAIHPGYGFVSENPEFAKRCQEENIIFIGPSIECLKIMGSKQLAKQLLEKTNVALTPGYHGRDQSPERLLAEAEKLGFPVLIKASDGGGGKGMRIVHNREEFAANLASAKRESLASFGSEIILIEKLILNPRHIEVQIIADNYGKVLHLFERDCSIQRRYQKIIEEAPATISQEFRKNITNAAIAVAKAVKYQGAGTIEFLSDGENFYFMEMNTRLQVEHPVTEMITNLDIVELQIKIATGEPLAINQDELKINGHAIECRVYSEDPEHNFLPAIGKISFLHQETNQFIRIDSGVNCGTNISSYYDPMIAKVIAWGQTRNQARLHLLKALDNFNLIGIKNNILFLKTILQNQNFIANKIATNFLTKEDITYPKPDYVLGAFLGASLDYLSNQFNKDSISKDAYSFQMHLATSWFRQYLINNKLINVAILAKDKNQVNIKILNAAKDASLEISNKSIYASIALDLDTNQLIFNDYSQIHKYLFHTEGNKTTIFTQNGNLEIVPYTYTPNNLDVIHTDKQLTAPMPGTIIAILKTPKQKISAGEPIIIIEAMKMEHTIVAPSNGIISEIFYSIGAQVKEGEILVALEKT